MALIPKLIVCPAAVYVSSLMFPSAIRYGSFLEVLLVGVVLALVGYITEKFMLAGFSNYTNTLLDAAGAFFIVLLSGSLFPAATVTFTGAVIAAFILGFTEYVQHFIYKARV